MGGGGKEMVVMRSLQILQLFFVWVGLGIKKIKTYGIGGLRSGKFNSKQIITRKSLVTMQYGKRREGQAPD